MHLIPASTKMTTPDQTSIDAFLADAEAELLGPLAGGGIARFATALKEQLREALQTSPNCMLPSFNHNLPTGLERGRYMAIDMGGTTLRMAIVELTGRTAGVGDGMRLSALTSCRIGDNVKALAGLAFFDWLADRIYDAASANQQSLPTPIPLTLSWSFPIE